MCVSIFSSNIVMVRALDKTVYVNNVLDVATTGMQESQVTYIVNIKPDVFKFNGAIIYAEFDPNVLEVVSASPVTVTDEEGNVTPKISGEYIHGFMKGSNNKYSLAYMNTQGYTTKGYESLFKITFKVITSERPSTEVKFFCKEVITDDDKDNDVRPTDGVQEFKKFYFSTLDMPKPLSTTLLDDGIIFNWEEVDGAEKYSVRRKADNEGVWNKLTEVPKGVSTFTDKDVESGVTYTYSVTCGNGYGDSDYLAKGVSQLYLAPPEINVATLNNTIKITWKEVNGAGSYGVYRKDSIGGEWVLLEKTSSQRFEYTDSAVESNVTYYYSVVAENGNVITSNTANEKSHLFLASPVISTIENTANGIKLTWNYVSGADYYELYRRMSLNEEWELISDKNQTSYLDTDVKTGFTYFYTLKTVKNGTVSSFNSTGVSIARIDAPETIFVPEVYGDGIIVRWSQVSGATGYTIYRKELSEKSFQKVMSVGGAVTQFKDTFAEGGTYIYGITANIGQYESLMAVNENQVYFLKAPQNINTENVIDGIKLSWEHSKNATSYIIRKYNVDTGKSEIIAADFYRDYFIDIDVTHLAKYSYSVNAVDRDGTENNGEVYTQPTRRVNPPFVTGATAGAGEVVVTWNAVPHIDSYNIYRKEGSEWLKIGSVTQENVFKDTTVLSGVKYEYTVTAVKDNAESYIGEENKVGITYVSTPTDLKATLKTSGIALSWTVGDDLSSFAVYKRIKGESVWQEIARPNSTVTTILDENTVSGVTYEYSIKSFSTDGNNESGFSEIAEVTFLSKVSGIKVSSDSSGVKVSWNKVSGAEEYVVYRKLNNGSWGVLSVLSNSKTSYKDKKAESGKTYYYTVRAVANNCRSAYEGVKYYYLAAPKITKTESNYNKGITIKWADVHGASKYYVYRKQGKSGWKRIGTTENLLFKDTGIKFGTKYIYTVRANGNGVTSSYNKDGWSKTYSTANPSVSSISNTKNSITVKWGKVSGATSYRVYRKAGSAKSWTRVATVKGTSYKDKNVKNGTKYTYTVRAYRSGVASDYNKTGWNRTILSTPTVKISNASSGVKVSWNKIKGAEGYTVYSSEYNESTKKWSSWKNRGTTKSTTLSWTDKKTVSGKYYKYTVRAVSGSTKGSYKSSSSLLYLAQPKVTVANAENGVTVSWTKSSGCSGYIVYSSQYNENTGKWTSWKNRGTVKYTKTSWVDKSVYSGDIVRYTVRAVNGKVKSTYKASEKTVFLEVPALLSAFKTGNGIVVEFKQVPCAKGYILYRKTEDTAWQTIGNVEVGNSSCLDTTADLNTEYIYTVRAFNGESLSAYDKDGVLCK